MSYDLSLYSFLIENILLPRKKKYNNNSTNDLENVGQVKKKTDRKKKSHKNHHHYSTHAASLSFQQQFVPTNFCFCFLFFNRESRIYSFFLTIVEYTV